MWNLKNQEHVFCWLRIFKLTKLEKMFPKHHCRIVRWKRNRRENKDEDDEDDAEEQDDEVGEDDDDEERMFKNI